MEAIPDPFLTFGPDGRVQLANASFIDLVQRPRHDVVDRELAQVLLGSAFDSTLLQRCDDVMRSGHAAEFETVDAQGRRFEVGCFPAADGVAVHARDITERTHAEAHRKALESQLRQAQKMESIGTLAGGIAHDFNNILGSVLGSLTLVRDALPQDSPALQPLAVIEASALRARVLVQQILTFGRQHAAQRERQPLQPLIEETRRMLRSTLPADVSLDVVRPAMDICAEVDAHQLQQVLLNLCTNAWYALPASGGRIEVGLDSAPPATGHVTAAEPGPGQGWAHLWVRDDGCGMAPEVLSRIFEPFFTTRPVGQGTGLGLSVAHGIVVSHGGVITADSTPGRGATFHVHLPRCQVADAARPAPARSASRREPAHLHGVCVLCVDDDPVMLMTMQALLERQGCRVRSAPSAADALAQLRESPSDADILVTDYNMPDVDGLALIAATREIRAGLPIVLASGFIDAGLRERARSLGVCSLVQKERIGEDLVEAVRNAISTAAG